MTHARETIIDGQTGDAETRDNREPLAVRDFALWSVRESCRARIEAAAPDYRQRNAALGLLTDLETLAVKAAIQDARAECAAREDAAQAAYAAWDGSEDTRAAACDAIERCIAEELE